MNGMSKSAQAASKGVQDIGNAAAQMSGRAGSAISSITSALSKMGPVGIAIGGVFAGVALAIAGVVKAANAVSSKVDNLAKSAKSVDMSANGYIALQHACAAAGVSMDKMLVVIQKVDDAIVKAAEGTKKARDAFYSIGLSWRDLERMTPEQRLIAIIDAMRRLKAEGKTIPSEFRDMIGRRGMAELNKAEKEDFGTLAAEANALGYTISPEAVALAEQYQTTLGNANQKLLATLANMKLMQEAQKTLNDLVENWTSGIGEAGGKVSKEMREFGYVGIGDVVDTNAFNLDTIKTSGIDTSSLRNMLYNSYKQMSSAELNGLGIKHSVSQGDIQIDWKSIENLTEEELQKQLLLAIKHLASNGNRLGLSYAVQLDKSFNGKMVKKLPVPEKTPEELNYDRAEDSVDDYISSLSKISEKYSADLAALGNIYDAEERIAQIERERNVTLDEELKKRMRLSAEIAKQQSIELQSAKMDERAKTNQSNMYAGILDAAGALAPGQAKELFNVFNEIGKPQGVNQIVASLNAQLKKAENGGGTLQVNDENWTELSPRMLTHLFKGIADDFSQGNISTGLNPSINDSLRGYNEWAKKNKQAGISFNPLKDNPIDALKQMKGNMEAANDTESPLYKNIVQTLNDFETVKLVDDFNALNKEMQELDEVLKEVKATTAMDAASFDNFMGRRKAYGKRIGDQSRVDEANDYEFLKAAGVDVSSYSKFLDAQSKYSEQLKENRQAIRWQNEENWAAHAQNNMRNLIWDAMEKSGGGTAAAVQRARYEATEAKGSALTRTEQSVVDRLAYLQDRLSRGAEMPNFSEQIHTNELASKGGFVGGVTVDNSDTPRKQLSIMQTMSRQVSNIASEVSHLYNALNNY